MDKIEYQCINCGQSFCREEIEYLCPFCGAHSCYGEPLRGVLETVFDYEYIGKQFDRSNPDWNLFSPVEKRYYPEYPVGNTPFSRVSRLGEKLGFQNLWVKNDGLNPSGSLKDRASFLVVAEANRLGEQKIVTASTGNAASSLAAVCAAAGKEAIIFAPSDAPRAKLIQVLQYGGTLIKVDAGYDEAFKLSIEYTEKRGGLNRNTAYNPLTIEGKKSVGLEIFAQNGLKIPDVILVPVGDGVIISGVYKAFYDLQKAGLIDKLPKIVCVQAESSDAIHHYITRGVYRNAKDPSTIADSISVVTPSNAYLAKRAVDKTNGFSITVTDEEILVGQKLLAGTSGVFAEPAAAAGVAGLKKIARGNLLQKNEQIVLLITGHGLKDLVAAEKGLQVNL